MICIRSVVDSRVSFLFRGSKGEGFIRADIWSKERWLYGAVAYWQSEVNKLRKRRSTGVIVSTLPLGLPLIVGFDRKASNG